MAETEARAKELGADTVRVDTFDWQGKEFYEALGYRTVGSYENTEDGYSEYFFLKRIYSIPVSIPGRVYEQKKAAPVFRDRLSGYEKRRFTAD